MALVLPGNFARDLYCLLLSLLLYIQMYERVAIVLL